MCASNAPTPITTSVDNPRRCDHSADKCPTGLSAVWVLVNNFEVKQFNKGSKDLKNSLGGSPPYSRAHNALWPAAHTPRFIWCTSAPPVNKNGIQSQCSAHE